ncbi:hypothetical protein [Streptomyces tsukubensis]|uniref:Uncharacterized protein n=1 Tax=Streptomyces tsukubensis (strain DSM 42081 / NBRC 108919 / NRRL 18488 / 9993) TaxID=1114943 RepID=A0A7G3UJL6_STRT9|nr:hypothetical protein [Streptomyces tsukubensis]AZK94796.1 hypothetical protein B7R87_13665 [Streptomyces tsukubensis]QKM69122.1 hypothetical protein STSU_020105 [Streptomyces tsukubensis NRRL18488]TAI42948.1 hypothetical protein EWI31_21430 [Streptomyces tsukubensis]
MKLAGLLALVVLVVPAAPIARADTPGPAAGTEAVRVLPDPGRAVAPGPAGVTDAVSGREGQAGTAPRPAARPVAAPGPAARAETVPAPAAAPGPAAELRPAFYPTRAPAAGTAPGGRPVPVHRAPRAVTPVPRITVAGAVPAVGAPGAPVLAPTGRSRDGERIWLLGGLATALAAAGAIAVVAARGRREPRHDGRTDV